MNLVLDDFLPEEEFIAVRERGRLSPFHDHVFYDGETYKRVWVGDIPELKAEVEETLGREAYWLGTGFRLNYEGELPNAGIHTDVGYGDLAFVYFLNDVADTGTAFFRHIPTGRTALFPGEMELLKELEQDWNDMSKWEVVSVVPAKPNRIVIFSSYMFHSRWPLEGKGTTPEDGRLIAVGFFK